MIQPREEFRLAQDLLVEEFVSLIKRDPLYRVLVVVELVPELRYQS